MRRLSKEENEPMSAVLDKVLEHYRREKFLRGANADFAALKRDPKAWNEALAERALWDQTVADGLGDK